MAWYHHLGSALASLLGRRRADRELAEEIRHHLELEAEWNRRQGLSEEDARRRAVRSFGGVERYADEVRDERGARAIDTLLQDLRFAWRSLGRQRGFTLTVVLTLGFGIGATTALFAVVKSALLAPLPYGQPDRVAMVWSAWKGFDRTWVSYDEYEAWKTEIRAIDDAGIFDDGAANLTDGDQPERVRSATVGANVFAILGVAPILGRGFTAEEDRPNGPAAAILSHELWHRRYGADPAIVGRAIQVAGQAVPVVGVMPPGFRLPLDFGEQGATELYQPLAADPAGQGDTPGPAFTPGGSSHSYYAVARLAPGATVAAANGEFATFLAGLVRDNILPADQQFRGFAVGIEEQVTGPVKGPLLVLLGAVGVVLLIACANVAGLLLVRGERRRRELAVRVALGAETGRLTRLLVAESGLLALLGGGLGIAIAWVAVAAVRQVAPASLPRVADTRIEPALLGVILALASLAAILTSILPALQAARVAPAAELKEGSRGATVGAGRLRWRQALVTTEVALAVVLVIGAGLLVRSVANLFAIDSGFTSSNVLTLRLSTPSTWYPDSARIAAFWSETQARVAGLPGIRSVGAARLLPLATEMGDWGLQIEGYTPPPNRSAPADWQVVTPGYFETLGLRLREGRFLEPRDDFTGPLAMVINRRFAELYLPGRSPLGTLVRIGGNPRRPQYTIVGVVDDVRHNGLTTEVKAQFYVTMAQFARSPGNTTRSMSLVVKTDGDPANYLNPVRAAIREIDPRLPIAEVRSLDDIVAGSIAAPRFAMQLLGVFGLAALVLSAIGVFGVVAHVVAMREQEFGIRAALGARPAELVRLSLATGLRQTIGGIVIGVIGALLLTRLLGQMLEGVSPTDPITFATVVLLTGGVALVASAAPAMRAARAHPALVLRAD
jgi:predicted permease